ncbi:Fibrinogen-like protein A [Holothuria leucospilota]|uniref:Fibrinogen-like protein A n=1 Tax=Holothuria leucospilota TaxID=206669 RepID=A0A9Q1BTY8_HOLLE|nr:Fibrinogen-like protein A [Holothuria leucospilota]
MSLNILAFSRAMVYYKGFGFLSHEFWLGNDTITVLTTQRNYQLRIDLVNGYGAPYYATYSYF